MSAEAIEEIIGADPEGPMACLAQLLGEGFADALAAAIMACLDADAVKALIVDCLTNPDTSPLTKEMLSEILQGEDLDDDGVLGATTDSEVEGTFTSTSTGIKILTVTGSQAIRNVVKKG